MDRMSRPVKRTPRRYDSSRRAEQARQNRQAVLDAARQKFLHDGYASTTLAAVAADAGVSIETVYKVFSNKAGLLKALFDVSVAGDDEDIAMADRELIRSIAADPDPARKITRYCEHLAEAMPRVAPVQLLARDAAAADDAAASVWSQTRHETLGAMTMFARNLAETDELAVSVNEARDILWTYHSPELYELLVLQRHWSTKRYGRFLATALITALIRDRG
jgi:AcrR family transcriptional regulator